MPENVAPFATPLTPLLVFPLAGSAEKFCLKMSTMSNLKERLDLFLFKQRFPQQMDELNDMIQSVEGIAERCAVLR